MLVASSGRSEEAFEALQPHIVDSAPIGSAAKLFDPNGNIEGLTEFEFDVTSGGYHKGVLSLCPGVIELPNGSLSVSVPDEVPEEIRGILACMHLLNGVDKQPIERSLERAMRQIDPDQRHTLGSTAFFGLRQAYYALKNLDPIDFKKQTNHEKSSSLLAHRIGGGQGLEFTQRATLLRRSAHNGKPLDLHFINNSIKLGERKGLSGEQIIDLELRDISLVKEPSRPIKPHFCRGCTTAILPNALRVTVGIAPNGTRFDHHHFHVVCAQELFNPPETYL